MFPNLPNIISKIKNTRAGTSSDGPRPGPFCPIEYVVVAAKAVVVAANSVVVAAEAMRRDEQQNAHSE